MQATEAMSIINTIDADRKTPKNHLVPTKLSKYYIVYHIYYLRKKFFSHRMILNTIIIILHHPVYAVFAAGFLLLFTASVYKYVPINAMTVPILV